MISDKFSQKNNFERIFVYVSIAVARTGLSGCIVFYNTQPSHHTRAYQMQEQVYLVLAHKSICGYDK